MKNFLIFLACILLLSPQAVFAKKFPQYIDGKAENDFILDEMLPNPAVYLYGTDSNGYPLLLMDFSLTIPIYAIDDNPLLKPFQKMALYAPFFHKKIKSLKYANLYLKIEPTINAQSGKNFYYKILKLKCDSRAQKIGYVDENTLDITLEPEYNGMKGGHISDIFKRTTTYASELPIITYSGVGSDILKIMLKRGKKYKIPCGHIDSSMVVLAIPDYCPPLNYKDTSGNQDNQVYVRDFMDAIENSNCPCQEQHSIRKINFAKYYWDNSILNYYELTPCHNPNCVVLSSEVIRGNRINQVPISSENNVSFEIIKKYEYGTCAHNCPDGTFCNPNTICKPDVNSKNSNCKKTKKTPCKNCYKEINNTVLTKEDEVTDDELLNGIKSDITNYKYKKEDKYEPMIHTTTRKFSTQTVTKAKILDDSAFMPVSFIESSSSASEDSKPKDVYSISVKQFADTSKDADNPNSK